MELFHVLSRGVDKRDIFLDDKDRFRFVHDLFEFNSENQINSTFYQFQKSQQYNDLASRWDGKIREKRKTIVYIHAFCIMNNHYHLLISPKIKDGIVRFMRKLNMGYAKYFNIKYNRKGSLFESRYKSILVKNESHFIHLPYYIHLNPLDLVTPEWRFREMNNNNIKKAIDFLKTYRWSSYLDYIGIKNFPSVIFKDFILECLCSDRKYEEQILEWLKNMDLSGIGNATLDDLASR